MIGRASIGADLRRGLSQSPEDLAIAALVMAPFALTLGIWAGWLTWAPAPVLIGLTLAVEALATVWNAGWRAGGEAA
jgi:hypothetical protein